MFQVVLGEKNVQLRFYQTLYINTRNLKYKKTWKFQFLESRFYFLKTLVNQIVITIICRNPEYSRILYNVFYNNKGLPVPELSPPEFESPLEYVRMRISAFDGG